MKQLFSIALLAVLLAGCLGGESKNEKEENDASQTESDSIRILNEQLAEYQECMDLIDRVNEGFTLIKEAEGQFEIHDGNMERARQDQVMDNMQFVQQKLQENRELIEQLKQRLNGSNSRLASLANQVKQLEADLEMQSKRIRQLEMELQDRDVVIEQQNEQIGALNESVSGLESENAERMAEIAAQDKELNKAWFVFGTKKELKANKILDGGEVLQNGNFNRSYFTEIDIRYVKDIELHSKSVDILTTHPAGSYQLVKDSKGYYELHISSPTQFWSVSKYLVVKVK